LAEVSAPFRGAATAGWLFVALIAFAASTAGLAKVAPKRADDAMRVAIPRLAQVALFGGDRHLAANFTVFRALVTPDARNQAAHLRVQAIAQREAAWLNPAHEDNYYVAAAILPWGGEVDAAQQVLAAAIDARPFDMLPGFFYGFNELYFRNDPVSAAKAVQRAARAADEANRHALEVTAARWFARSDDPAVALGYLTAMREQARTRALTDYLDARILRLERLIALREAAAAFAAASGRPPRRLDELVGQAPGLLAAIPEDPLGLGFTLDGSGQVRLVERGTQRRNQ
jgi:hypothetical protein